MILLCTLGTTWAVIPEILAFLDPERFPLFGDSEAAKALREKAAAWRLAPPDEVWVVTTQDDATRAGLEALAEWWESNVSSVPVSIWLTKDAGDLTREHEIRQMRELIFRAALHATERGSVVMNLAGGRKTMSADLQSAGHLFGAQALLHVVDTKAYPSEFKGRDGLTPAKLRPDPDAPWIEWVVPVVLGVGRRSDVLDVPWQRRPKVVAERFPLPPPLPITAVRGTKRKPTLGLFAAPKQDWLVDEVDERETAARRVLNNYTTDVASHDVLGNWPSTYRLSPLLIDRLRTTSVRPEHEPLIRSLPKADLHRHLGGALGLDAQIRVGKRVWADLNDQRKRQAERVIRPLLAEASWPWTWPDDLRTQAEQSGATRTACIAGLLTKVDRDKLHQQLFEPTRPRRALKGTHPRHFSAYERPGELMGSAILGHPAAIEPYARECYRQAVSEGLTYLELRGSPMKYLERTAETSIAFINKFAQAIRAEAAKTNGSCEVRFIVTADRRVDYRSGIRIADVVAMALRAREATDGFVVGLDLAGDEGQGNPESEAGEFVQAFEKCMPLTIHAGEGEPAENVWKSAYLLHADRIGHGLTVVDRPDLAVRFRNRAICLELCPTSNLEVVGFLEHQHRPSRFPAYPLGRLLALGLPMTICTDNPYISQTTLAGEYVVAASLAHAAGGDLKLWQALALIRQAFVHAFLPANERDGLLAKADERVFDCISSWWSSN